jgi:hypothetical protein
MTAMGILLKDIKKSQKAKSQYTFVVMAMKSYYIDLIRD